LFFYVGVPLLATATCEQSTQTTMDNMGDEIQHDSRGFVTNRNKEYVYDPVSNNLNDRVVYSSSFCERQRKFPIDL